MLDNWILEPNISGTLGRSQFYVTLDGSVTSTKVGTSGDDCTCLNI